MKRIGIIVAMDKEFRQLSGLLEESTTGHRHKDFTLGRIGGNEVILQQCGIGKVNAAVGAVEMIDAHQPDLVLSTGVAGGASVSLNPLDVVVATECAYHDFYCGSEVEYGQVMGLPARFAAPAGLVEKALAVRAETKIVSGLTVSGDWFVDSKEKMRSILDHFPEAMAVDMESCSIAQTCHLYGVPFVSLRIISDVPLKDHKAAQYFDFWNRMAEGSFQATRQFLETL